MAVQPLVDVLARGRGPFLLGPVIAIHDVGPDWFLVGEENHVGAQEHLRLIWSHRFDFHCHNESFRCFVLIGDVPTVRDTVTEGLSDASP